MERSLSGILRTRSNIWQLRAKVLRVKRSSSLKLGMEPKYGYGSCKVRRLPISEQYGDHSRRGLERSAWIVHAVSQLRFRLPRVGTRKSSPSIAWAASSTPHMRGHNAEDEAIRTSTGGRSCDGDQESAECPPFSGTDPRNDTGTGDRTLFRVPSVGRIWGAVYQQLLLMTESGGGFGT
ncbi:hypothetical protein BDV34DRAFT_176851 [Aspergillus parasiticus]|uniref:Uncharacterized protein n=1 Tax=Aspergillus parasiticus TaxID=5067 RepID=A0A5N6DXW2_ASPPA|nr:hypothetical protein BDV34DRAFT_176851 [Aspergillus parasiticus]